MEMDKFPSVDEYGTMTVARFGGWLVQICPMIFNNRVILTPEYAPLVYDYGWCYPKGPAALEAVIRWDPDTEGAPAGFVKAIQSRNRQPGETA